MATPESEVIEATSLMVSAVRSIDSVPEAARSARGALGSLPGFRTGDALASALISATDASRMAVYDRRAHRAIARLGFPLTNEPGRYGRYMTIVSEPRDSVLNSGPLWLRMISTSRCTTSAPEHLAQLLNIDHIARGSR